jgi:hypothetical protein
MDAPQSESYTEAQPEKLVVLFRIISRRSWDEFQGLHEALPGSQIEHVMKGTGIFVLHLPPGGAEDLAA